MKKLICLLFVTIMCCACTDIQNKNTNRGLHIWNYEFDGHLYVIAKGIYADSGVGITHSPNCSCYNNEE